MDGADGSDVVASSGVSMGGRFGVSGTMYAGWGPGVNVWNSWGWHWVRSPGWLIVVDFLFGQNVYFMCLLLPPPQPLPVSPLACR